MKLKYLVFPIITLLNLSCKNSTGTNTTINNDSTSISTTESIIKINNMDSLYHEFIDNPYLIQNWLMDSTIEINGYFDDKTFRTYIEIPNNNRQEIVNTLFMVSITTDVSDDNINSHSIIKNPSNGHKDWVYDKQDRKVYIEDEVMNTSNEPSIGGGYSPIHLKYLIGVFDEQTYPDMTMNRFDEVLNYIVKNEKVREDIRNNKVSISPYPLSPTEDNIGNSTGGLTTRVIDKVTIRGKVYKMELRNNEQFGEMMDLRLKNVKIISSKRSFDMDNLPVLDYLKVKSVIGNSQSNNQNSDTLR